MADSFAVTVDDNGIASTIADGRAVPSIKDEPLPFVFGDELLDRLADVRRSAPAHLALHFGLLCPRRLF
jgi:hypothetical protein